MTAWKKVASVTPGGKHYFWTAIVRGDRYWVVWDRDKKKWAVETEKRTGGYATLALFATPIQGQRFAEGRGGKK